MPLITDADLKKARDEMHKRESDALQTVLRILAHSKQVEDVSYARGTLIVNGHRFQLSLWEAPL